MKTAVLIVNYNGKNFLGECLDSLLRQSLAADAIVVVENGSSDGSVLFLRQKYPQVTVLEQKENRGFAEGNNRGISWIIKNIKPDYLVLMNNDTRADAHWLRMLVDAMESDRRLGSASSCMLYAADEGRINNAGDMPLWDGTGVARGRHQESKRFAEDAEVFGACAGAAIYRRQALEETAMGEEYFDRDYFAYNEDVDLSWRLRKKGWGCRYVAGAKILHHHAGTSGRFSTWVLYHGERNRCWTLLKNFSWGLILISPVYTLCRLLTIMTGSENGKHGTASNYRARFSIISIGWTILRAWAVGMAGAPQMLAKRWKYRLGYRLPIQLRILRQYGAKLKQTSVH